MTSSHYSDITVWKRTDNRQDDDHEVEDVPAVLEVVFSEGDDLQNALNEEDDYDDEVKPVQDLLFFSAQIVCLHHQKQHIQADHHHHDNFVIRFGHQVED